MAIKVEDVYKDMDKLIDTYVLLKKPVSVLRLTPEQWERMSNDFQRAIKKNILDHPVENRGGGAVLQRLPAHQTLCLN